MSGHRYKLSEHYYFRICLDLKVALLSTLTPMICCYEGCFPIFDTIVCIVASMVLLTNFRKI